MKASFIKTVTATVADDGIRMDSEIFNKLIVL